MKKKLSLSKDRTYIYPIWDGTKGSVVQKQIYGGNDSKTVPCGYVTEIIFKKKQKRRQKLNKRLETVASRYVPSLATLPNS